MPGTTDKLTSTLRKSGYFSNSDLQLCFLRENPTSVEHSLETKPDMHDQVNSDMGQGLKGHAASGRKDSDGFPY